MSELIHSCLFLQISKKNFRCYKTINQLNLVIIFLGRGSSYSVTGELMLGLQPGIGDESLVLNILRAKDLSKQFIDLTKKRGKWYVHHGQSWLIYYAFLNLINLKAYIWQLINVHFQLCRMALCRFIPRLQEEQNQAV